MNKDKLEKKDNYYLILFKKLISICERDIKYQENYIHENKCNDDFNYSYVQGVIDALYSIKFCCEELIKLEKKVK